MEEIVFAILIIILLFCITYIRNLINENRVKDQIIEEMTADLIEQNLHNINQNMTILVDDVRKIKRGLYGDPDNKVLGLIDRQEIDEKRIVVLEGHIVKDKNTTKRIGIITGSAIALVEGIHQIKDWFYR